MTSEELFVAGTRTFSAEVVGYAKEIGFRVVGLLEPYDRERVGLTIHGLPVTWLDETVPGGRAVVIGTGEPSRRSVAGRLAARGWRSTALVHPAAHVPASTTVGVGAIVAPGVVVGACSVVGDYAVVGRGSLVGHHTEIGPFATLGPGANVAGNVRIGADAFIGMAAVVRDHVSVGDSSVVAMGAVVVGDVAPRAEVRGLPARGRSG